MAAALEKARDDREPQLVEAVTYRFRGHSMADPEEYRTKDEVEEWRQRDPIKTFAERLVAEGVLTDEDVERLDAEAMEAVDEAVEFADDSPFPDLDVALRRHLRDRRPGARLVVGRPSARPTSIAASRSARPAAVAQELAEAGAAHADDETDPDIQAARARGAGS